MHPPQKKTLSPQKQKAQYWPDPESFRPERFLSPDAHPEAAPYAMQDPLAFLPFGLGTRRCLGYRYVGGGRVGTYPFLLLMSTRNLN